MKFIAPFSLFILLFFSNHSWALGQGGHKLVCQLAYDMLPISKQQKVNALIDLIPIAHKDHINRYLKQDLDGPVSFAKSCVWADAVKRHDDYKQFSAWHFINVDRDDTSIDAEDCDKDCITRAIEIHKTQLVSNKNNWKKVQALMFLGHWIGDIHQPLHVSFQSDWGGNKVKVESKTNRCTTLHWIWDSCIIGTDKETDSELVAEFSKTLKNLNSTSWLGGDHYTWATESLNISRTPSVSYCKLNNQNKCIQPDLDEPLSLTEDYISAHRPILKERILKAAVRLSDVLEKSL